MLEKLLAQVDATAAELFTGKFTLDELFKFIHALVKAAEVLVTEPHSGETKHALVKEAWEHYDTSTGWRTSSTTQSSSRGCWRSSTAR